RRLWPCLRRLTLRTVLRVIRPLSPAPAVKLKLKRPLRLTRIVFFDFLKLASPEGVGGVDDSSADDEALEVGQYACALLDRADDLRVGGRGVAACHQGCDP